MATIQLAALEQEFPGISSTINEGGELEVLDGEKVDVILTPIGRQDRSPRPFGLCKGQFTVPDDFNDPLPELEEAIYGAATLSHGADPAN